MAGEGIRCHCQWHHYLSVSACTGRQFPIQDDVQERTNFHLMDFICTDFPDQTFDAVVAIESVCYAKDKNDFLREA